jgi:hypothetical protein
VAFSFPFGVALLRELGLGSRSVPPHLAVWTQRLESAGRSL